MAELDKSTRPAGYGAAIVSCVAVPISVGVLLYVHVNPHELIGLNGGLILIWICGAIVALVGVLFAAISILWSRFRRRVPWLSLVANGIIVLYALLAPIVAIINGLMNSSSPGWH